MKDRAWKETDHETEWDFFWADVHWIHEAFDKTFFTDSQRINHFRNHYELTRKDLLVKNVVRMKKTVEKTHGKEVRKEIDRLMKKVGAKFDFIATSFVLPQDYGLFQEEFKKNSGSVWIMKPAGRAQGKGIYLINKSSQIPIHMKKKLERTIKQIDDEEAPELYIVQRYVENPYLIGGTIISIEIILGKKFDIRLYVLVSSFAPLQVFIHRNGFCRFSNYQYSSDSKDISNLYQHLTNVAIQKTAPDYKAEKGCKWLLRNLKLFLITKHGQETTMKLFTEIEALVIRSLLSVQKIMIQDKHCFEVYGYDILIDQDLKPWLLEVNASPSVSAETQWDYDLKHAMLNDAFNVIDIEKQ